MSDAIAPGFEFEWRPALWGAAATIVCGAVVLLALGRPSWLFPTSIFGGIVAGLRGGYYSQHATNGLVAVGLGLLVLVPVLVGFRALWLGSFGASDSDVAELAFLGVSGALADVVVFGPLFLGLGYLGAMGAGYVKSPSDRSPRQF